MKPEIQENIMRRYLLGDLSESETSRLEQELFADDEKFERMWETENDLVDGYVRGRLSTEDRERFERHYLASPVHRRRVAVARNLTREADRSIARAIATEPKVSFWERLAEKLGLSRAAWQFALSTAVLLFAATSLWLFVDRTRMRNEIAQLKAESEARQKREESLADQIAAAEGRSDNLATEVERLRAELDAIAQQPTEPASRPHIFSFLLSPLLIRSGGETQTLTIPLKADDVRLRMKVKPEDARSFQVVVRREGRQVWEKQSIKPHTSGSDAVVSVSIPAGKLPLGDYILTLSAIDSTGETEEVDRYFFRVIRK